VRRRRTIYFNDARHYYLFVFEPPMRLEDAWLPIDEIAGTAVDTFSYGVSRGDGLFYPSKHGIMFGDDLQPFQHSHEYRSWQNMQSLIERGLDPLKVLIDRSHEKGIEFFASLRLGNYGGMNPDHSVANGGRGFVHEEVRIHQIAIIEELVNDYDIDGLELDFSAAPGGSPFWLQEEDVSEYTPVMTEFIADAARIARGRPEGPIPIGARIYPTERLNTSTGLDIQSWFTNALVDFAVPLIYADFVLDANMPIEWLVAEAHKHDISIYAMLQPYCSDESRRFHNVQNATIRQMAAAAANFWQMDIDGLYTWFLSWPLGDPERRLLTEIGDPDRVKEADKHYFLRRPSAGTHDHEYPPVLPVDLTPGGSCELPFTIADDPANPRLTQITLRLAITNLVSKDHLTITLNGRELAEAHWKRDFIRNRDPYAGQWLEIDCNLTRPQTGSNELGIEFIKRADSMAGKITVEDVELIVEYGTYGRD
jgi:hypothetical protein